MCGIASIINFNQQPVSHSQLKAMTDIIMKKKKKNFEYLNINIVNNIVQKHLRGENNSRLFIWSLIYLTTFLKLNHNA